MAGPLTPLGALWIADRHAAVSRIVEALRKTRGDVADAALILGVNRRTLFRYLPDPVVSRALAEIRTR